MLRNHEVRKTSSMALLAIIIMDAGFLQNIAMDAYLPMTSLLITFQPQMNINLQSYVLQVSSRRSISQENLEDGLTWNHHYRCRLTSK